MTEETPGFEQEPDLPTEQTQHGQQAQDGPAEQAGQPDGAAAPSSGPAEEAGPEDRTADDSAVVALTAQLDQTRTALHERTQDLQRLQAEFSNYRRRVERDRIAVREIAVANALTELLPVLDDIGRARDHGELVGGFKSVAESLETVVAKMGLQQFGKEGEPFDPTVHEALMHSYSPDVTETTCVQILQPGYRIGERTIRPARVGVAEPQPGAQPAQSAQSDGERQADTAADEESGGPEQG
ncbi:nucleotide exchange factor GrpE [Streptomyces sp. TRM 70361]|uniref:nucleotide exchange factor GrpE n=1 Tax=Streptomyces sp. TRM 70361 TaxID=3116553 RepID=UPI002E7B3D4D|nr:nucleotide exchange factor GrpE [Streptomyces sp. TRM 70361]MEE1941762.1 nucleotide exchange factor GrpE [Streptomyces sp. TRM 70361]